MDKRWKNKNKCYKKRKKDEKMKIERGRVKKQRKNGVGLKEE